MKATKTFFYIGGRRDPEAIQKQINDWEELGWRVQAIVIGMGGMWVVFEKGQK